VQAEGAEGGTALKLALTGESWGGVYFILDRYDAGAAGALSMRLKLPSEIAWLELKLEGPEARTQSVNLIAYAKGRGEGGWRTFTVPLTEFDEIDLSRIRSLGLWNPSDWTQAFLSCEMLVDAIGFE
jgi:hypothetical protein